MMADPIEPTMIIKMSNGDTLLAKVVGEYSGMLMVKKALRIEYHDVEEGVAVIGKKYMPEVSNESIILYTSSVAGMGLAKETYQSYHIKLWDAYENGVQEQDIDTSMLDSESEDDDYSSEIEDKPTFH